MSFCISGAGFYRGTEADSVLRWEKRRSCRSKRSRHGNFSAASQISFNKKVPSENPPGFLSKNAKRNVKTKVIGIDLAGSPANPSGFAVLSGHTFHTRLVHSDQEIVNLCLKEEPTLVAIDAPLSSPARENIRKADTELIKRGLRVFPPTFAGMRLLTKRGIRLAKKLRSRKIWVIEIHPRTSGVILFKTADRTKWVKKIKKMGFCFERDGSKHETDAALAALSGMLHLRKKTEVVGDMRGKIVIPLPQAALPA